MNNQKTLCKYSKKPCKQTNNCSNELGNAMIEYIEFGYDGICVARQKFPIECKNDPQTTKSETNS